MGSENQMVFHFPGHLTSHSGYVGNSHPLPTRLTGGADCRLAHRPGTEGRLRTSPACLPHPAMLRCLWLPPLSLQLPAGTRPGLSSVCHRASQALSWGPCEVQPRQALPHAESPLGVPAAPGMDRVSGSTLNEQVPTDSCWEGCHRMVSRRPEPMPPCARIYWGSRKSENARVLPLEAPSGVWVGARDPAAGPALQVTQTLLTCERLCAPPRCVEGKGEARLQASQTAGGLPGTLEDLRDHEMPTKANS